MFKSIKYTFFNITSMYDVVVDMCEHKYVKCNFKEVVKSLNDVHATL